MYIAMVDCRDVALMECRVIAEVKRRAEGVWQLCGTNQESGLGGRGMVDEGRDIGKRAFAKAQ